MFYYRDKTQVQMFYFLNTSQLGYEIYISH